MLRLYNTALLPLRLAIPLVAWWRGRVPERRREWAERLGRRTPDAPPGSVWIHGASVGEAALVRTLAAGCARRLPAWPVVVSAMTPTGRARLPEPPAVRAAFHAPLDLPGPVARVLRAFSPSALLLVETELWPNLLAGAERSGADVIVANGRLAARRMRRYRRFRGLYGPLLARVSGVGAQSAADAARFVELGVPPGRVRVTGNVKFDVAPPPGSASELRARLGLDVARAAFVAGSTAAGEEPAVLEAFLEARRHRPELLLVLAPRHLSRIEEVARALRDRGLPFRRLTGGGPVPRDAAVLLVDTLGELAGLYRLACASFVGGSLVPVGGHNLLEPAAAGSPVLFGPHVENVTEVAHQLLAAGGAVRVSGPPELAAEVVRLASDGDARARLARGAEGVLGANRGAVERTMDLLSEVLERRRAPARSGAA